MSKKDINFFEKHIEKIVLVFVGLVCVWLLFTRFLLSPHYVEYNNSKFGPEEIDPYISKLAEELEDKLARRPVPKQAYKKQADDFAALIDSAITDIDVSLVLPQPSSKKASIKRAYRLPQIGQVSDAEVELIMAVAYVPTEIINEKNVYGNSQNEPNDIDFVTVEAKFDVAKLYQSFYENFVGEDVKQEWRDPCLAEPVFAAVELQRQELLANGSLSSWQTVPRARIDHHKKIFEIIEDVENLPAGGIKVRLLQFSDGQMRMDLLQPQGYKIASAQQEWFPPSLHKRFNRYQQDMEVQEKRHARITEKQEREKEREKARERSRTERQNRIQKTKTSSSGDTGRNAGNLGREGGSASDALSGRVTRGGRLDRRSSKERLGKIKEISKLTPTSEVPDFYEEFDKILITEESNFARMSESLVFWAHDDTVEPEKTYRYRIRLGVFNPIAGTDQLGEQDKSQRNKVILWSKFSDITESISIPARLYFFPHEIQETSRTVTVRICKYVLGYWHNKDFMVKCGEVIGKLAESEPMEAEEDTLLPIPETIDYSTGAVLVDVIPVNDWSGGKNLRARHYFDMLYSFDGSNIGHIPVKPRYWAAELQAKFNEIKKSEKDPKEPLRTWNSRWSQRGRRSTRWGGGVEEYGENEGDGGARPDSR